MSAMLRKYPVACFYLLAIAIVTCVMAVRSRVFLADPAAADWPSRYFAFLSAEETYGNAVALARFAWTDHWIVWSVYFFAGAPTLAAIVVALGMGQGELKRLFGRFRLCLPGTTARRCTAFYAGFFVIYFAVSAVYLLLTKYLGSPEQFDSVINHLGGAPATVVILLIIGTLIDEGATFEEIGWRGFALPHLLDRGMQPLMASILLGMLWWFWHFPREIPALLEGGVAIPFVWNQTQFALLCIGLSVLCTFGYQLTGGSIWPGIMIHGGTNVWSKALSGPLWEILGVDLRNLIVFALAILLVLATRGRLAALT